MDKQTEPENKKYSVIKPKASYAGLQDSDFYQNSKIYDYDFLVAQKDAKIVQVPSITELMHNSRFNKVDIVAAGKKNAGYATTPDGHVQVKNTYTNRTLTISNNSIKHGIHGPKNRILTNAQIGTVIGDIVREGIPINALHPDDQKAMGTYAMVTLCETTDHKSIMAVTHVDIQRGTIQNISFVDMVHSVNGRLYKKSEPGSMPINASVSKPSHSSRFTISISDLLLEVNDSFRSILSEDVLSVLGNQRPSNGVYAQKVKFSISDQTETPEFRRWFGNSMVVNEDGSPKVMYHGTASEFWAFDKRKANDITGRRMGLGAGKGKFYLTEYKGSANAAAYSAQSTGRGKTPKVMELYVSAQKVMDRSEYNRRLEEAYKRYPHSSPADSAYDYRARDKAVAYVDNAIRKAGYDGVWDHDSGEMFVFEPTQIKSATDNVGTFDADNPDIRYSISDQRETQESARSVYEQYRAASNRMQVNKRNQSYFDNIDKHAPIKVVKAPKTLVPHYTHGGINRGIIFSRVRNNPLVSQVNGRYVAYCEDIERYVELNADGIKHGFGAYASKNKEVFPTPSAEQNARAALLLPELLENAVEVNRSSKYASAELDYGHVLLSVFSETDNSGRTEYYAVRIVVEHQNESGPYNLLEFGVVGQLRAVNAKKLHNSQGSHHLKKDSESASSIAAEYSIAQLIKDVNAFSDTFSVGAYRKHGIQRRISEFSDHLKYSLRDVDAANDEMARLLQENGELRGLVNQLSAQLKGRNGAMPDPSAVRQLARRFKEDSGTRVPLKTLTENLQTAYAAMANAQSTAESQAAMEMMGSIAQDMLEKSAHANHELYDQYEEMRKYFKGGIGLTSKQWQEVKKVYGSNKAFRQATARHLKVRAEGSGGVTLDNKWGELCERWPAFFREDTNEGDQVEAVLAALEAVQITYENPYGDSLNDYANDMAMLMYQEYMAIPEVKDGKTRQIEKLTTQLDEARATIRRQAAQVRKVGRLETRIQEYRDAARGRYQRQAQRRKDNQDYSKMRAQVIRQRDQLMRKLLEPKVGAFVPQGMHDAVMELIRSIDFEGRLEGFADKRQRRVLRAESINRARDEYLAMARPDAENARGPFAAFVNGDLEGEFDLLAKEADGLAARDLSMRQMEALRNIVAGYSAAVVNADRLFMQDRRDSLSTVGNEMAAGMLTRRERMKQGKAAEWLRSATSKGLLKPVTVFHQFKGTPMEKVWKALRNAENIHIRHVSEAEEYLQAALHDYHQQESIRLEGGHTKRSKAVEITLDDGRKMKLTDQELMTLYAVFKREQKVGTNHLLGGGFTLANAPRGSSTAPVHIVGPTLQEILDRHLTQEQKAYVDHMVKYLSTTCADWGNEVTLQLYGVEKFHEDYYIPFTVNKNYVAQEPAAEQDSRLKTGSFTKALTPQASTPLEIRPFTELWCEHVEKMSDYNAFVLPIEDMTRLMNYKTDGESIRALMKRHYSPETANYIMNFLSRLNGNSRSEAGGSWLNAFMGKAKAAAVTYNASVAIQQMGSASRAMAMIDPKYFIGGSAIAAFHKGSISSSYKELEQYAPIAILKSWGYFDTNMARGLYTRAQGNAMSHLRDWKNRNASTGTTGALVGKKLKDIAEDWGGKLAELGDRATWARIWEAVKLEISDTTDLEKGSEAYYQACADRFTEVIDGTQVVDSVFQRAEWATEKGLMKQQMSFMSEPLTMYNMLYRAGWDIANAGDSKAARHRAQLRLGRALAAVTLSSAVTAALKSVVSALRDRDNEKKDEEGNIIGVRTGLDKWLDALGGNFLENMLGIGSIFTNMVQGAFSYYSSDLTTQWLSDFAGAFTEAQKGAEADWSKVAYKTTRGLSSTTGIGFGNLWRDVESIFRGGYEYFNRDLLAGSAWDTSLPFGTRLAAAEKNYVMKKQGDKRKVNTGIYYDLMLAAYFESGLGEDYQAVLDAAIRTGGSETMWQTFKKHLRVAETRLPGAAQALLDGDMATYSRLYNELLEGGIGERAVASMIISEVEALSSEDEEDVPANSNYIIGQLQRSDVDTDPVAKKLNMDYNAAVDAENPQKLKAAIDAMRKNGMAEKDLRKKVSTSYKNAYCWAVWNGETKVSTHAATMMKGAGVGIDNDDLKAWTSSLSGDDSYGSDQLYKLLREGNGKQAHVIHKYLISANSSDAMEKKLKNWCRQHVKGKDDEKNVRAALKQMGYAQSTIDSWFQ